ncbi:carcinoembryonic antigen-related cell adhesion molecule 20-like isoform X1 [Clarias gariepinus]|uniref:carcinoembryonic antigen-related cell adhesion molecule 20-like isoform X1 n=1 Tax=Clarias gariepinus TaxID=13013 RepID=UPI00234DCDC6|nr:carcinoembryonic antigen-related cell adhesion molecule 20-like isoform X1 [Clarias gariepinus]
MDVCVLSLLLSILCLGHYGKSTTTEDCTPLDLTPSSLLVEYGKPAHVHCSIQSKPEGPYILGWESKTDQPITNTEMSLLWSVDSLTDWEETRGLWCYRTDKDNNQITCKVNLTIFKPPDSITLTSVPNEWTEGTQTELWCEIVNVGPGQKLSVNWNRADQKQNTTFTVFNTTLFPDLVNNISSVSETVKLNVTATREDDGVQYQCEAVLDLDQHGLKVRKSQPINITVHYKPIIRQSSYQVHVYSGESLTIDCSADGNPRPDYTWTLPNNTFSPNSSITITSVRTEHQGRYTCIATNSAGEATMNVTVIVTPIIIYIMIIVIGVVVGIVLLVALACGVYRMCYRPTYMGQYILKQLTSHRQNGHVDHNTENQEQQL